MNVQYPAATKFGDRVHPLLKLLGKSPMEENLIQLTSFFNRYYLSESGNQSGEWLLSKVNDTVIASGAKQASVIRFNHTDPQNHEKSKGNDRRIDRKDWHQPSVIARIPGKSNVTVIIGAHHDSVNNNGPDATKLVAPGADDNGSGTVTILEAMRVLLQDPLISAGEAPNTVEFHWYSGEESGLLGSMDVFWKYNRDGVDVRAMLQQDMTGYVQGTLNKGNPEAFGITSNPSVDQIHVGLNSFVKTIIKEYTDIPYVETTCGYACSDHVSATRFNYPSAFVLEAAFKDINPFIHSPNDTVEHISYSHMLQHAKLTLGLAYELAFADLPKGGPL
jgi:leucyl aminopeptidase